MDPPPAWLLFPYHPIGCYVDVRTHPAYCRVFEASRDRIIMLNRRSLAIALHTPEVANTRQKINQLNRRGYRLVMRSGSVELRHEVYEGPEDTVKHPFITTPGELEAFLSLPIETDPRRLHAALDRQLPRYRAEHEEFPERYGAMMPCLGEPIGGLYGRCDLAEYAIASLTHAEV